MSASSSFACTNCGAELQFAPGTEALACPYCGTQNEIAVADVAIEERDFEAELQTLKDDQELYEVQAVHCESCGAESTLDANVSSDLCPFCGTSMVLTEHTQRLIKPQAVLPFKVKKEEAEKAFRVWLRSLWFAPNDLKEYARREGRLAGMYLPYWTFDAETTTRYTGQRGEYYYVTESYTDSDGNRRTRRKRRTRWYPAQGTVYTSFDDVLVVASDSLPRNYVRKLEPWELDELRPYTDEYLSGFRTESYTVELEAGYRIAQERMQPEIDRAIRRDIGGDTQRIASKDTSYADTSFKHILLPVWLTAYRYSDDVYRIIINARTGEVQGERPWSTVKIALAVITALTLLVLFYLVAN